jgi:hypothetical protein
MPRFSFALVLEVLALACPMAAVQAATGDRCSVANSSMIGVLLGDGQCRSFTHGFAEKYLHVGESQCTPAPQKGVEIAGKCVPDDPPSAPDVATSKEPNLSQAIQVLNASLLQLRAEVQAQSAEIEWLRSQINELQTGINR